MLNMISWVPYIVSLQGFRSINMAIANSVITIVMGGFVIVAVQETTSRLAWAFARDNGLVFSQFIGKIDKHLDIPKYSLIFGWVWLFLCGLLHLVSATGELRSFLCHPTSFWTQLAYSP